MASNNQESTMADNPINLAFPEPECALSIPVDPRKGLEPFIMQEFWKANHCETIGAFKQRIWQVVGGKHLTLGEFVLGITGKNGTVRVHPDVSEMVEALYRSVRDSGAKCYNLRRHLSAFNTTYIQEQSEIKSLLREFVKLKEMNRDPNNQNKKDKILKDNSLNVILAVDGMLGKDLSDLNNYIGNFGVGNTPTTREEQHVVAVREMYRMIPEMITGTDSTYLISMVLLSLYNTDETGEMHSIIESHIDKCKDHLVNQAGYYREINDLMSPDFLNRLRNVYTSAVDVKEIAREKLDAFVAVVKKKNASENKKGDQKKRKSDDESESSKKRPKKE